MPADQSGYASASYAELPYAGTDAGLAVTVSLTGVAGTGAIGTATVKHSVSVTPTGASGTGAIGTVVPAAGAGVTVTGVAGTGQIGTAVARIDASVIVTGVSATGGVGETNVWGIIDASQTPDWTEIAA